MSGGALPLLRPARSATEVIGREFVAQVLPGWRFKRDRLEVKVFAGLDLQDHRLSPDDPASRLRGSDFGAARRRSISGTSRRRRP